MRLPPRSPSISRLSSLPLLLLASLLAACGSSGSGDPASSPALGGTPTATLVVTNHDDHGPGSLRQAILDAPSGAWIVFDDMLPAGDILLEGPLVINNVLTIGGLDAVGNRHGIDGQSAHRLFHVDGGALQLNDFVLHHGAGVQGGAIRADFAHLIMWRTHVHGCFGGVSGGAIRTLESRLEVYACFFENNDTDGDGGAIAADESTTRIERTSFYMNEADTSGGAVRVLGGTATIVNSAFHANTSVFVAGGAIRAHALAAGTNTTLAAYNCTITQNSAGSASGGVSAHAEPGMIVDLTLQRCVVAENMAASNADIAGSGTVNASGERNIIGIGSGLYFHGLNGNKVGDGLGPFDPELAAPGPLADGRVVSFPIPGGACVNMVPAGTNLSPEGAPMIVDLRFFPRFPAQPSDIGAIEL